jgi:hypothetical protein
MGDAGVHPAGVDPRRADTLRLMLIEVCTQTSITARDRRSPGSTPAETRTVELFSPVGAAVGRRLCEDHIACQRRAA